jgi:beta-carotene hydroxylase
MLRHRADRRALLWAFVLFPAAGLAPYIEPRLVPWLLPMSLYLGFSAGPLSHNHNHCPVFRSRRWSAFYSAWLGIFWGPFPSFGWIPTHNLNHHKLVNRAGDATITWRYSKKNTWLVASTYYFVSSYWQSAVLKEYVAKAKASNPAQYRQVRAQQIAVYGGHLALVSLGIALHGAKVGVLVWAFGFGIPAVFAGWSSIFVNFIQHVHCDPWSDCNHSRNFVSRFGNWLSFNNGYHTAHHAAAGLHWSRLPEAHAKIARYIHPDLNQKSLIGFCLKAYLLGALSQRCQTRQVGRAAYDPPAGGVRSLDAAPVGAVEVGVSATMTS